MSDKVFSSTVFFKALLEHVNTQLTAPARRVQIVPGNSVVWDDSCGQLSLAVMSTSAVYASKGVTCPAGYETTIAISLLRCIDTVNDAGKPPSATRVTADAERIIRDMHEVGNALQCYVVPDQFDPAVDFVQVLSYRTLQASGGITGGEWTVRVRWGLPWQP